MSSAQTRLATHFDTMDNLLIQATGRKRVVFWPPEADAALYTASGAPYSGCISLWLAVSVAGCHCSCLSLLLYLPLAVSLTLVVYLLL